MSDKHNIVKETAKALRMTQKEGQCLDGFAKSAK